MKKTRAAKYGTAICPICGDEYEKYTSKQNCCPKRRCKYLHRVREISKNPLLLKARNISGSIRLGKGKMETVYGLLCDAIGNPCVYCGTEITIENASIDHKTPRQGSKVWDRSKKKQIYTDAEIRELDKASNLHIVCRACNQRKGEFNHEQFILLLAFLSIHADIKELLFKRFNHSVLFFKKKRNG
jgi:5-methylcytosine-specific restriction endonuclease McrA